MIETQNPEIEFGPQFDQINLDMAALIHEVYPESGTVEERFKAWWTRFATFCNERPFDFIYMDQLASTYLYPKVGNQAASAFYKETRRLLQEGQDKGLVKMGELSLINQFVRLGITNVIKINMALGRTLTREEIDWLVSASWDGIRTR